MQFRSSSEIETRGTTRRRPVLNCTVFRMGFLMTGEYISRKKGSSLSARNVSIRPGEWEL